MEGLGRGGAVMQWNTTVGMSLEDEVGRWFQWKWKKVDHH